MKKIIVLIMLCMPFTAKAQDTIKCYNSEPIIAEIVEVNNDCVKYKYMGENLLNTIYNTDYSEIVLSSGRVIKGKERVIVNGEEDWQKVVLTYSESDVKGLEKVSEISEKATSSIGAYGNIDKMKAKAKDGLKKKAAKLGCHIVLITEDNSRDGKTNQDFKWTKGEFTGIAYKYPTSQQ